MRFAPLFGKNSIQYANGTDWENRRRCIYRVFRGDDLLSYFPYFVQIAQVREFFPPFVSPFCFPPCHSLIFPSPPSRVGVQEVEETWAAGGTEEKISLQKTFFYMTMKGIARCIFGKTFDDSTLVNNLTKANMAAWEEMEVRIGVSHTLAYLTLILPLKSIAITSYTFKSHKNAINYILAKFTQRALSIFHGPYTCISCMDFLMSSTSSSFAYTPFSLSP